MTGAVAPVVFFLFMVQYDKRNFCFLEVYTVNYFIRDIHINDYQRVVEIYNSNSRFLFHHLGMECIDEAFVSDEVLNMSEEGFNSCVIVNRESQMVQGVLDFKDDKEVYLSLIMLAADLQGKGIGREVYSFFESEMMRKGNASIRIDVVNDYQDNIVPFWMKLGFVEEETIMLNWGNKRSQAVVMRKNILR